MVFVHYAQQAEKTVFALTPIIFRVIMADLFPFKAMHAGVVRDIEQQRVKKERLADFEMQRALEQEYRKVQKVSDGEPVGQSGQQR